MSSRSLKHSANSKMGVSMQDMSGKVLSDKEGNKEMPLGITFPYKTARRSQ